MPSQESPLVTVVTPSLNQGQFIEETIRSIHSQDYPAIEHLVIDGGSTDNTLDILRQNEDRLSWISESDDGQSDAINKGWRRAQGDILSFINSDDTYLPGGISTAVEFLVDNPEVDIVYGDLLYIDEQGGTTQHVKLREFDLISFITVGCYVTNQSAFMRREVFERVGEMDVNLHMTMDYDYWVRCAQANCKIAYLPKPIGTWRFHSEAKSTSLSLLSRSKVERKAVLDRFFERLGPQSEYNRLKRKAYSKVNLDYGIRYYNARQTVPARRNLLKALSSYPLWLRQEPRVLAYLFKSFLGAPLLISASNIKNRLKVRYLKTG
jgi:glycosyltransferase involved in cell wall biosynthesis